MLPTFVAGTLVMVVAVIAIARIDNDWADLIAVACLVAITAGMLMAIAHRLDDDDDDEQPAPLR